MRFNMQIWLFYEYRYSIDFCFTIVINFDEKNTENAFLSTQIFSPVLSSFDLTS